MIESSEMISGETYASWQDRRQIELSRKYEVRDWCRRFGCSKEELHDAVKAVGPSVRSVREYLERWR